MTEMHKWAPRQRKILDCLRESKQQMTPGLISKATGISRIVVSRELRLLTSYGCVTRHPAVGHQYKYQFVTSNYSTTPIVEIRPLITRIESSTQLSNLLRKWSEEPGWKPKIFDSAKNLPLGLAQLYSLAVEASYGAVLDQTDLNTIRSDINNLKIDLEQTLRVVNGILSISELWSVTKLPGYLMRDEDIDQLNSVISQVKENN